MSQFDSDYASREARRLRFGPGDPARRAADAPSLDKAMESDRMSIDANANPNQAPQQGQAPQSGQQASAGQQPQQAPQGQAQAQGQPGQAGQLSDAEQQQFAQAASQLHQAIQSHGQGQAPAGAQANVASDFLNGLVNAARNVTPEQIRAVLLLARVFGVSIPGL